MKKNSTMRVAALLLALTLMTSCFVGGTFAKYTTGNDASDSARVAHWGVVVAVTGQAFAENYKDAVTDNEAEMTVKSSTGENIIAPGTEGTFTGVSVTGSPEVDVNISTVATITIDGFMLAGDVFYCPIIVHINDKDYCGLDYTSATAFASALKTAIEVANGDYDANTDLATIDGLNGDYEWEWAFETGDHNCNTTLEHSVDQSDGRDTELGNRAANGYLNKITIAVSTTVTQID